MAGGGSLRLAVGPGLGFRLEDQPEALIRRAAELLDRFVVGDDPADPPPIRITAEVPPVGVPAGSALVVAPPVEVRRMGELIFYDTPEILGWCDVRAGRGGVVAADPTGPQIERFVDQVLCAMLFELAPGRGWLGIHAAAVAFGGRGILLPGASGTGKSTIFAHARAAGLDVLSDDLVWLRQSGEGFRLHAFPRGDRPAAAPTADDVPLVAIVCPAIAPRAWSERVPTPLAETLGVLLTQSGFLGAGSAAGDRFRLLVRAARSVPGYRLEAGSDHRRVPALLREILAREGRG